MSRLLRITQGLLLAGTIASFSAGADLYYKWDKDGVTQYTKEKPRDIPSEEVRITGGKLPSGSSYTAPPVPADTKTVSTDGSTTEKAAPVKKDPKICEQAKNNLSTLQSTAIVRMKDEYGNETVMDDKQRDDQLKRAQEAIKTNC